MSVFTRSTCEQGHVAQHKTKGKSVPHCKKCGAVSKWSDLWYVKLYDEKGKAKYSTFTTKALAEKYESEQKALKANGESIAARDTTFLNAEKIFLDWCDQRVADGKMTEYTCTAYKYRLKKHVSPYFSSFDIRNIDHSAADAFVAKRKTDRFGASSEKRYSPAAINRDLATLKKLIQVSVLKKLIKDNPLRDYELLPENNKRDNVLNQDQIDRLLSECEAPEAPMYLKSIVVLALNTGLRKDGILGLRWEHIENGVLKRVVKNKKEVAIPLNPIAINELQRWEKILYKGAVPIKKTGPVFPSPKTGGQMLVTSNIGFESACERAGLKDFHFHDLRHCAITYMVAYSRDIHLVAGLVGHSSTTMTERYAHILEEKAKDMMSGFGLGKSLNRH